MIGATARDRISAVGVTMCTVATAIVPFVAGLAVIVGGALVFWGKTGEAARAKRLLSFEPALTTVETRLDELIKTAQPWRREEKWRPEKEDEERIRRSWTEAGLGPDGEELPKGPPWLERKKTPRVIADGPPSEIVLPAPKPGEETDEAELEAEELELLQQQARGKE
jgi:hypothetical protein